MTDDLQPIAAAPATPAAPAEPAPGGLTPLLDQLFDADSLYALRAAVAAHASAAGLDAVRTGDLVIAAHELAANAVRHGAGHGRLRLWVGDGALHCEVTDDGPPAAVPVQDAPAAPPAGGAEQAPLWDSSHGHGLWLVRKVADQAGGHRGPGGTTATARFDL